ncbi:GHKL domain-containing protein [Clostridium sp. C1]|uniref:GHKL domain-containing protein n=1 Tax=Clostridium sp. C1 TaxID=1155388 RepID=UPI001BA44311|nr:GHKL domain-containing protein [Clostridium sp. C1]QUN14186.1 GHKL domain-containing protein [Clostridium sp. C1]
MIINLLCKALIAILDILLLDFYLKNIYPEVYARQFKRLKIPFYITTFILILFANKIIDYFLIQFFITFLLCLLLYTYKIDKLDCTKNLMSFYSIKMLTCLLAFLFCEWLFNIKISTFYFHTSKTYILITHSLSLYLIYTILFINMKQSSKNFKYFKIISIILILYLSTSFILNNPILFRTVSIARTYIFTVVISIVALICFDRMQTKYETDKHTKEAIIQNMAKEEEFVQELEKQQLEIRKINHNLNHILIILQSHLKQGEYKEALEYIDKNLDIHIKAYQALTHTGMTMIDSTINHQIYQMKEQNIEYDEDITKILHLGSIVPDDLSLVLGLAFDNAREACEKVKDQRKISLKLQSKQTHIIIHITNSIPRGSHPYFHKTSKKDSVAHGYGVKGIKEIAKKYHGDVKYDVKDDCVILRIMLQK